MAFGKAASCLILAAALASAAQFAVRHKHLNGGCAGAMTVDENGVSFTGAKKHAWSWKYEDIQELALAPDGIRILTYKDSRLRLGKDREYNFTGKIPAEDLYALLRDRMDQRFVAAVGQAPDLPSWSLPVKHLRPIVGSEGTLAFGAEAIVYSTPARDESRTWRYSDVESIGSSGPFQLTITTLEKGFNFQLKQPITEARYNQLWLQIEKKNGRIQ
ncbi:MAG: hypothetical protein ABSG26_10065 [Bryobacteraceae bacterium]